MLIPLSSCFSVFVFYANEGGSVANEITIPTIDLKVSKFSNC